MRGGADDPVCGHARPAVAEASRGGGDSRPHFYRGRVFRQRFRRDKRDHGPLGPTAIRFSSTRIPLAPRSAPARQSVEVQGLAAVHILADRCKGSPCTFIQYWLIAWGSTRAPRVGTFSGRNHDECCVNSPSVISPRQAIANLGNLSVTGQATSGGMDAVIFSTGDNALHGARQRQRARPGFKAGRPSATISSATAADPRSTSTADRRSSSESAWTMAARALPPVSRASVGATRQRRTTSSPAGLRHSAVEHAAGDSSSRKAAP